MPLFEPMPGREVTFTDQYTRPTAFSWTFSPVDQAVRSVRDIIERYLRTEQSDALTRELFSHRFQVMNPTYQRGFDARYPYHDINHGQWARFFLRVNVGYEYVSPTRANWPGFTVQITPDIRASWFVGDIDAQRVPASVLQTIGQWATRTSSPAFLSLGPVQAAAIIGIIPEAVLGYRRLMPRGDWPRLIPPNVVHQPFHIVMGYQFAYCPDCHRGVVSLPTADSNHRETVSHGMCGQYAVPLQDRLIAAAIADAASVTDLTRRQESYTLGGPARWW